MIRHGEPPFLECSGKGEKAFSAFFACIIARGRKSIEQLYQEHKVFEDGSTGLCIRDAKGRLAINQEECNKFYGQLWDEYIKENPKLLTYLRRWPGLQDSFGQPGHVCQATELWRIRNDLSFKA
jgi:hypothetical protein